MSVASPTDHSPRKFMERDFDDVRLGAMNAHQLQSLLSDRFGVDMQNESVNKLKTVLKALLSEAEEATPVRQGLGVKFNVQDSGRKRQRAEDDDEEGSRLDFNARSPMTRATARAQRELSDVASVFSRGSHGGRGLPAEADATQDDAVDSMSREVAALRRELDLLKRQQVVADDKGVRDQDKKSVAFLDQYATQLLPFENPFNAKLPQSRLNEIRRSFQTVAIRSEGGDVFTFEPPVVNPGRESLLSSSDKIRLNALMKQQLDQKQLGGMLLTLFQAVCTVAQDFDEVGSIDDQRWKNVEATTQALLERHAHHLTVLEHEKKLIMARAIGGEDAVSLTKAHLAPDTQCGPALIDDELDDKLSSLLRSKKLQKDGAGRGSRYSASNTSSDSGSFTRGSRGTSRGGRGGRGAAASAHAASGSVSGATRSHSPHRASFSSPSGSLSSPRTAKGSTTPASRSSRSSRSSSGAISKSGHAKGAGRGGR